MARRGDLSAKQPTGGNDNANPLAVPIAKMVVLTVAGLLLAASLLITTMFAGSSRDEGGSSRPGEEIGGGPYLRRNGTIKVAIPSNGIYAVPEADAASFTLIDGTRFNSHVGRDKTQMFCGNMVMEGLNPATTKALGNDYYSDGKRSYFCASYTNRNEDLSAVREVWQLFRYSWFGGKKPQTYLYPMVEMPASAQPYRALLDGYFATDGVGVFDRGMLLPKAKPASFRRIIGLNERGESDRPDSNYSADGSHVYYDGQLTDVADTPTLRAFEIGMLHDQHYLTDMATGKLTLNGNAFAPEHAPYTPLTRNNDHSNHALFLGKDGIYFYNNEDEKVERAGDNVFASGKFKALTPSVFFDGKQIYYLRQDVIRKRSRRQSVPQKIYTYIERLEEAGPQPWHQVGEASTHGLIWSNGRDFFYLDTLGQGQLIDSAIYRITDEATKTLLLSGDLRTDGVRDMVRSGKLAPPKHATAVTALSVHYRYRWMRYFPWVFGLFVFIAAGFKIYEKRDDWRNFGRPPPTVP